MPGIPCCTPSFDSTVTHNYTNNQWLIWDDTSHKLFITSITFELFKPDDSFLARGELLGWLANQAVRRKQWKLCNRFLIVSSSAGAFTHSLNGR